MFQTVWCYAIVAAAGIAVACTIRLLRRKLLVSKLVLGLLVAAALIAAAGAILFAMQNRTAIERQQVRDNYKILRGATRLSSAIAHAESGQRGYVLTLDKSYLETFTAASEKVATETTGLRALLSADVELQSEKDRLTHSIAAKLAEMRSTLVALDTRSR